MQEMQEPGVQSLRRKNHLEEEMATQFNLLAWRIPQTEDLKESDMTEVT